MYSGVTTAELDNLVAEIAAYRTTQHPDYAILAARIAVSNLHKQTKKVFLFFCLMIILLFSILFFSFQTIELF